MYVDDRGNIGYKTSGEIPLREDLQAGTVAGLPPYFLRNGTGGNEWIADPTPAEDQASPYELLPFAEMDGLVNPKRGWISNANQDPNGQSFDNDPLNELRPGGGIRYITPGHSDGNRNARVTKRLQETLAGGDVSFSEMTSIQADQKLNDAEVLTPYITAALRAAQTPGAPPALAALGQTRRCRRRSPPRGLAVLDPDRDPGGLRCHRSVRLRLRRPRRRSTPASPRRSTASGAGVRWRRSWTARSRPGASAASCREAIRR